MNIKYFIKFQYVEETVYIKQNILTHNFHIIYSNCKMPSQIAATGRNGLSGNLI